MPSDHLILDNKKFANDIYKIEKNITSDHWITLGIKPTKPSKDFWIY